MRLLRIPSGAATRLIRGYAASAPKPASENEHEVEPQAESSTAAQRRLWPAPPSEKPPKATRLTLRSDPETAVRSKRRRSPNAIALIRAQKLAQAIKAEPVSTTDIPLTTSKSIKSAQQSHLQTAPTLEDLEAKRPVKGPLSLLSRRYSVKYKRLYDQLDNAFVAKQLLKLAREMGVKVPKGRGKGLAIKGIMGVWGWEPPLSTEVMEGMELAQEVVERDWELRKGELWLMMRDPESLRPIMDQGVRFSIPASSPSVMEDGEGDVEGQVGDQVKEGWRILRGTGTATGLAEMDSWINERREVIGQCTRIVDHVDQSKTGSALFGAISSVADVYIERESDNRFLISGLNTESVAKAELLLRQSTLHTIARTSVSRSLLVPSIEYEMAFYPHLPAPMDSTPWQDIGNASRPLFRLRGVQPWEAKVGNRETAHLEEDMARLTMISLKGAGRQESTTVETALWELAAKGEDATLVARFGHVLYSTPGSKGNLLSSPITNRQKPAEIAGDLATMDTQSMFIPSLPPALIHFPLESTVSKSRQLTYRANDGRFLEISQAIPTAAKEDEIEKPVEVESGWYQELDHMLEKLEVDPAETADQEGVESGTSTSPISSSSSPRVPPRVRILSQKTTDIAMPNRPIDLSLLSRRTDELSNETDEATSIHQEAIEFLNNPSGLPPPTIHLNGETWNLISALELDITEINVTPPVDLGLDLGVVSVGQSEGVRIRTVKSTDLTFGSGRVTRYAELECDGQSSPTFWRELARLSRVVAPGAGALRSEIY